MTQKQQVVVIGAGIGGLTAGALLAKRGFDVLVLEQAALPGGCASTFKRRGFTFDVGATQVAGLEPGGIHDQIFRELGVAPPEVTPCDPACAVYLPGESQPISVWRDPKRWQAERATQFPGSGPFWQVMDDLFTRCWAFNQTEPILPFQNLNDLWQLLLKLKPQTLTTLPYALQTVGDVLKRSGNRDPRLKQFLDLQLKLYSQVGADETAALYGAVALGLSTAPRGLFHLKGSMQVLSERLHQALVQHGGRLLTRQRAERILLKDGRARAVQVADLRNEKAWEVPCDQVFANVTCWDLTRLLQLKNTYSRQVNQLPEASGAFVVYLGVKNGCIPPDCPPHLQFLDEAGGSLFVSVSRPGDGRAPAGMATIIASSFVPTAPWWGPQDYDTLKQTATAAALAQLEPYFPGLEEHLVHQESATPRTFKRFTHRNLGMVGGVAQRPWQFGPLALSNRTPVPNVWLVGDSTYPGEGTAGVSYSARNAVRLLERLG
ncbi:C-3',4' desaturase CrtD [Candidatus Cyanaurora vandensis]|uniref:C-3',4' desaturase CrtD n=1 Tax=Candidatus Cyanaurora vandensis TaxID=2714958 RepID=UPI00257ADA8B|nr:C-3',4' desaturase CrtD [Candidatus Cyanaurora vandensis]